PRILGSVILDLHLEDDPLVVRGDLCQADMAILARHRPITGPAVRVRPVGIGFPYILVTITPDCREDDLAIRRVLGVLKIARERGIARVRHGSPPGQCCNGVYGCCNAVNTLGIAASRSRRIRPCGCGYTVGT